ncbi:unnamed protein product [Boreogadus saida]
MLQGAAGAIPPDLRLWIYERLIDPPQTELTAGSGVWLGQHTHKHGLFKGVIQDVKLIFAPNGYISQCPNLNRTCPTCSDFLSLVQGIMDLQEVLAKMTLKHKPTTSPSLRRPTWPPTHSLGSNQYVLPSAVGRAASGAPSATAEKKGLGVESGLTPQRPAWLILFYRRNRKMGRNAAGFEEASWYSAGPAEALFMVLDALLLVVGSAQDPSSMTVCLGACDRGAESMGPASIAVCWLWLSRALSMVLKGFPGFAAVCWLSPSHALSMVLKGSQALLPCAG